MDERQAEVRQTSDGRPTKVERETDGRRTKVGRMSDGRRTDVGWKSDGSRTNVGQTLDGRRTEVDDINNDAISDVNRMQDSPPKIGRKWDECRTCKARRHGGGDGGDGLLQCCSDGWERYSLQRCCGAGRQRAAVYSVLAALLQQCYCDGQQHAGPRNVAAMSGSAVPAALPAFLFFILFFLYTQQLEERKRMGEREKFGHLFSSVPTSFVLA